MTIRTPSGLELRFLDESWLPTSWRGRPGSFVALMSLYESNHLRLSSLTGELRALDGWRSSSVAGDCELVLIVTERSPYTTMLELTYRFDDERGPDSSPDMQIRVYHDARLAEAHGWAHDHGHPALRSWRAGLGQTLDERWARNVMLNKWLDYCLERGHSLRSG